MSATTIQHRHDRSVPVEQLSEELARFWSDVTDTAVDEYGELPLHTDILTLIAVARGRSEQRIVAEALHHLAEVQPSRAIAVYADADVSEPEANVSANCRKESDGRVSCYELVDLLVPSGRLVAVPSILEPLELFDVPTFLWWVGEVDTQSAEFRRIVSLAERVIIDSSRFEDGPKALRAYHQFLSHEQRACSASDLTWARCTSWRELIAQSFDNPMARELLWGIQNVEIDYDPNAETQALLLAGWLAARLDWELRGVERRGATLVGSARSSSGGVTVALNRQTSAGVGLRSIRILARGRSATARTTIRRRSEQLATVLFETAGMRQERVILDPVRRIPELMSEEMLTRTRDRVYEDALTHAVTWLDMVEEPA